MPVTKARDKMKVKIAKNGDVIVRLTEDEVIKEAYPLWSVAYTDTLERKIIEKINHAYLYEGVRIRDEFNEYMKTDEWQRRLALLDSESEVNNGK